MFNLKQQVKRVQQLVIAKTEGLPYKSIPGNPKVQHIKHSTHYELDAENEGIAIAKAYKSKTMDFGKRLRKHSGQGHKRKGHYQSGGYRYMGLTNK